jgi:hypothetical protein
MIWQYGNYEFDCNLKPPTIYKFSEWKKDFFKLPNVNKYKVWLASGFNEGWKTLDIDIVLTNKSKYPELQKLMLDAIKLGVDKNIFVDICHWNIPPLNYSETKNRVEVIKTVVGNKIIQDGRMITDWTNSKMIYPNLYSFKKTYPTIKQMSKIYKNKPVLLNQGIS